VSGNSGTGRKNARRDVVPQLARELLNEKAMSFASYVDRVRNEFIEMPGLELSLSQAVRLWNLGADDCRYVLDALVDVGFLVWTPRRTVMRTGSELHIGPARAHISVRRALPPNKSVGQ
jgi:hypothetical protein